MRKFTLFMLILSMDFLFVCGQAKRVIPSIGVEFNVPAAQPISSNKAIGGGIFLKEEYLLSKNLSASLSAGYTYFNGKLVYFDGTRDRNFALIPVLIGGRYYIHNVYGALEVGFAFKASNNVSTRPAVSPSVGILFRKLDVSLRLLGIPETGGIPEKTFLQKGGYSYLGLRVAYRLNSH